MKTLEDLKTMPLRAPNLKLPTYLDQVADISPILTPTEVDHYQLQRTIDVYVAPSGEDLGRPAKEISKIVAATQLPPNLRINVRGLVITMQSSFRSFGFGLLLAVLLVYLVLVAQFASFIDPFLIILAVPTGLIGVMLTLAFTDTTLNVQSLMGIVMLTGMVVSNSILIVDFANRLRKEGHSVRQAVADSCRIRLRPILMTSLATIVGLLPMALKLETGSEAYAPLARVIIGGLTASVLLTIFFVPAAYLLIYRRQAEAGPAPLPQEAANASLRFASTRDRFIRCAGQAPPASAHLQRRHPRRRPSAAAAPGAAARASDASLTLQEAEKIAVRNHPQIQAATYLASAGESASHRSPLRLLPARYGSITGVNAENNSRITAGALNNPIIYDRLANGITVQQLVTDFGRTHELVKSSQLHAKAQEENVATTRADVARRRRRLLRRAESPGRAASRAGNRQGPPSRFRSNHRARAK